MIWDPSHNPFQTRQSSLFLYEGQLIIFAIQPFDLPLKWSRALVSDIMWRAQNINRLSRLAKMNEKNA